MFDFQLHYQDMDGPFTTALVQLSSHVRAITGGRLVWKDADPGLRRSQPRPVSIQDHAVCMAVKRQPARYPDCVAWCSFDGRRSTGCGTCHAGLLQWRWPVHDLGGLMGFACLGPFARNRNELPTPPPPALATACGALVRQAIAGLAHLRRQELGRLGWDRPHPCVAALLDHLVANPLHQDAATLAARVRVSPSRLQHLCREELGLSLRELRDRHLLERARRLLLDPAGLPVQRIADRLGFRNQRGFATWFRRQAGDSPTSWRSREVV
jgi:AraC-like DNA-binding protein